MKKGSFIILLIFLISGIVLSSKLYLNKKKPNNFYYTNLLTKNLKLHNQHEIRVLNTNFYKTKYISNEDMTLINNFFKSLKKDNFLSKPVSNNTKPLYKIFFLFSGDNEEYVINIYSSEYITLHPWDGNFYADSINIKNIPLRFNLLNLCRNIFNKNEDIK